MARDRLNGEEEKRKDNAETQRTQRKRREENRPLACGGQTLQRRFDGYGEVAGMEGFLAGVAEAEEADDGDEEEAGFDEEFAAVGPINGLVFQVGICE